MNKPIKKRLGDIVNFKRGYDLPSYNRTEGPYPIVSSSGISGYHSEYKVEGEGLITGRYGTLGEMYYINGKYWPHNTALYVTDFKGNYPKYMYYLMKCLGNLKTSDKSTVPGVNRNDLHEIIVPYIKPEFQKPIADCLFLIDAKIELNNCINAELEALAKTLYDYWFVQFDFPDHTGKPYKTSGGEMVWNEELKREIPVGWEVKSIPDLMPILTGKKDANFASENGEYPFFTCAKENLTCAEFAFEGKAMLLAGNGDFNVKFYDGKFNAYQRTYVLIPRDPKYFATTFFLINDTITRLTKGSRGSIIKFITLGDIQNIKIALPLKGHDNLFNLLNSNLEMIGKNKKQNEILSSLRDWLLPMLMNGQVTVSSTRAIG
jgi:type I restriction enzyme S subunit